MFKIIIRDIRMFSVATIIPLTTVVSCSSNIISAREINDVKKNVFNIGIYNNDQILTTFTSVLIKEELNKLIFLTTSHSFKSFKLNEATTDELTLKITQFYNLKQSLKINSKIRIIYDNNDEDIAIFYLDKTSEFNDIKITNKLELNSFDTKLPQANFLYTLGFTTLLDEDFKTNTYDLFFYLKDKDISFEEPNILFINNIQYSSGASGSPLLYKDKIIGLYLGKKLNNGKLTPFFKLFNDKIVIELNNFLIK
ncbi:hypothetical protein [Mycoplasmopsis bovirhinis]|nr:hypothetical protein [Mycoplasmopsis bovirhinis]